MQSTGYYCPVLMELEFSRQVLEKINSNIKFHENPSSRSRVLYMRTDGKTDMTKLTVAFCNFVTNRLKI